MRIFNRHRQVLAYSEPIGTRHQEGPKNGNFPFNGRATVGGQGRDTRTAEENELLSKNEHPIFRKPTAEDWQELLKHGKEFEH